MTHVLTFGSRPNRLDTFYDVLGRHATANTLVGGLYVLTGRPDVGLLRRELARLVDLVPRLRQHLVPAPAGVARPVWVADADGDPARHLRTLELTGASLATVVELTNELQQIRLEPDRSPWQIRVFTGLSGGRSVLFWQSNHALSAGAALSTAMAQCFGTGAGKSLLTSRIVGQRRARLTAAAGDIGARLARAAGALPAVARGAAPVSCRWAAARGRRRAQPASPRRIAAHWSVPEEVWRRTARDAGGSYNELFLAVAADALRRAGSVRLEDPCRLTMAVATRRLQQPASDSDGGNTTASADVLLAPDAPGRWSLVAIGDVTRRARDVATAPAAHARATVLDALPPAMSTAIELRRLRRFDASVSHLVLPEPLRMGGAEVDEVFMQPQPTGFPVSFGLCRFRGRCCLSVNVDAADPARPAAVISGVAAALAQRFPPAAASRLGGSAARHRSDETVP